MSDGQLLVLGALLGLLGSIFLISVAAAAGHAFDSPNRDDYAGLACSPHVTRRQRDFFIDQMLR